jgi:hypothetical protein
MQVVAADPRRWRSCDHIRSGYFKYSAGSHVLFFRRRESGIVVIRILHQSMDFERHLWQRKVGSARTNQSVQSALNAYGRAYDACRARADGCD